MNSGSLSLGGPRCVYLVAECPVLHAVLTTNARFFSSTSTGKRSLTTGLVRSEANRSSEADPKRNEAPSTRKLTLSTKSSSRCRTSVGRLMVTSQRRTRVPTPVRSDHHTLYPYVSEGCFFPQLSDWEALSSWRKKPSSTAPLRPPKTRTWFWPLLALMATGKLRASTGQL